MKKIILVIALMIIGSLVRANENPRNTADSNNSGAITVQRVTSDCLASLENWEKTHTKEIVLERANQKLIKKNNQQGNWIILLGTLLGIMILCFIIIKVKLLRQRQIIQSLKNKISNLEVTMEIMMHNR